MEACGRLLGRKPPAAVRTVYANLALHASAHTHTHTGAGPTPTAHAAFPNNAISNTKYNIISFVPLNLMEQFKRVMNQYFLIIACLQLIRQITPVNPLTTWLPLAVIFGVTAVKEAVDDLGRARADAAANARKVTVIRGGKRTQVQSREVVVGDIVILHENEEVPCDLVLLSSSDRNGNAFIQTTNLDGESNLKVRSARPETNRLDSDEALGRAFCAVTCAAPNEHIYTFNSQMRVSAGPDAAVLSLDATQLLLQATHIRNTTWVAGLAVYTGNETKFGKNKKAPPTKYTRTDEFINSVSAAIFGFQLLLVLVFGIVGDLWEAGNGRDAWYLAFAPPYPWYDVLIIPARFLLLNSTMIPISLKLTLDLCKLSYAQFINADVALYDAVNDIPAHSNSTALSEDLGQIRYVLTDKTGTLTENRMVLKVCTVLGTQYGRVDENISDNLSPVEVTSPPEDALPATPANASAMMTPGGSHMSSALAKAAQVGIMADHELYESVMSQARAASGALAPAGTLEFMRCLAINNDVVPSVGADGQRHYKASSPDEEALVKAASGYGVMLWHREGDVCTIDVHGQKETYTQLACFEFTSDRKRMSVIVRNNATGQLRLYCKGADDMIMKRTAPGQVCQATMQGQIDYYAGLGLRTLVMSYRDLAPQELAQFQAAYSRAAAEMNDRDAAKEAVYTNMEQQLVLIGATAIEDKLQDGVPQTIALLKRANISFWMLTGDKFSTALTIAKTCNLKPASNELVEIDADETRPESVRDALDAAWRKVTDLGYKLHYEEAPTGFAAWTRACSSSGMRRSPSFSGHTSSVAYNPISDATSSAPSASMSRSQSVRPPYTVIVRGPVIQVALDSYKMRFAALCTSADSVICCRVTPKQKALLVRLVKSAGNMTLAIGDGGNDVAMIQEAHVGIGIQGKEGLQAARAADYKVAFFRALQRLLLVHGRYSYYRTCVVAQYSFYKSFLFCVMQIGFGFFSGFAGVSLFNSLCVAAYNAVLFVPIVFFIVDKDITQSTALMTPEAYKACSDGTMMTGRTMLGWFARGLWQAVVLLLFGLYGSALSQSGDYESMGLLIFFGYMWVQDWTMIFALRRVTYLNWLTVFGMHVLAFAVALGVQSSLLFLSFIDFGSLINAIRDPTFWLQHLLVIVTCIAPVEALGTAAAAAGAMPPAGGGHAFLGGGNDPGGGGAYGSISNGTTSANPLNVSVRGGASIGSPGPASSARPLLAAQYNTGVELTDVNRGKMASVSVEQEIWNIFTFYTLHGNPLDPEHIRFVKLCRDCQMVGSSLSEADPPLTEADIQVAYTAEVKRLDKRGEQKMDYNDFLTVLMKLSIKVFPRSRSVDDAFASTLTHMLLPLASRRCPEAVDMFLENEDVRRLYDYYAEALEQIFQFYATSDKRSQRALVSHAVTSGAVASSASSSLSVTVSGRSPGRATRAVNTAKAALGYAEFLKFASDFDLSNSVILSTLEIGDIFLSSLRIVSPDASIRKLTFPEFWEALLRCALVAYSKISDSTIIDKLRGLFLYMWRAINRSVPRAFSERRNISTYAGDLLAGAMLFNKRFTAAWAADGYRDYLSPEALPLESGKAVLTRLLRKGAAAAAPAELADAPFPSTPAQQYGAVDGTAYDAYGYDAPQAAPGSAYAYAPGPEGAASAAATSPYRLPQSTQASTSPQSGVMMMLPASAVYGSEPGALPPMSAAARYAGTAAPQAVKPAATAAPGSFIAEYGY